LTDPERGGTKGRPKRSTMNRRPCAIVNPIGAGFPEQRSAI